MVDKLSIIALLILLSLVAVIGGAVIFGDMVRLFLLGEVIPLWRGGVVVILVAIGMFALIFIPDVIAMRR